MLLRREPRGGATTMKRSTVSRVLSPEPAVALIAGFAIAAIDINWIVAVFLLGLLWSSLPMYFGQSAAQFGGASRSR